jgi:transposase
MSEVFIGIDVHQKQSFYCALNKQGGCLGHERINTDLESLRDMVGRYAAKGDVQVAIETGGSTWWVSRALRDCGADVHAVNARDLKLIAHSKRKTDKYDSKVLADLLRCGGLPERVYIPGEWILKLRSHMRLRKWLVRQRSQLVTRSKALMRQVGVAVTPRMFHTKGSWEKVLKEQGSWAELIKPMYDVWLEASDQLDRAEERLEETLPMEDERMVYLLSIPGIGLVTARTFIAAVDDVGRFDRADKLVSYAGFAPSEHSSGEKHQTGSITKRGRSELRDTYVQAAWAVLRSPVSETVGLKRFFYRIMKKRCSQVAIVALAKKLLVISYYVLKQRTSFDVGRYAAKAA